MCRCPRGTDRRGSLETYIAAGLVLPLLFVTLFGGMSVLHLLVVSNELAGARTVGAAEASVVGGVTSAVVSDVRSAIGDPSVNPSQIQVTGTAPPVPWGGRISLTTNLPISLSGFPYSVLGLAGKTVDIGGTTVVTSNWVPSGP